MTGMRAASRLLAAGALGAVLGWGPQSTGAQTAGPATQHRPEAAPKKLQATPKPRPKAVPKRKPKPTAKPKPQSSVWPPGGRKTVAYNLCGSRVGRCA